MHPTAGDEARRRKRRLLARQQIVPYDLKIRVAHEVTCDGLTRGKGLPRDKASGAERLQIQFHSL